MIDEYEFWQARPLFRELLQSNIEEKQCVALFQAYLNMAKYDFSAKRDPECRAHGVVSYW